MKETIDFETMSLGDFIRHQDRVARELKRRFERDVALMFTDVVGSTAYFERHGDAAGRALVQRHLDLLEVALAKHGGRINDTAGDGSFCRFDSATDGAMALVELMVAIREDNNKVGEDQQLRVRCGLHWSKALVDEETVTGEAVNFSARIASSAEPGEIRISEAAYRHLPPELRLRCRAVPPVRFKGYDEPALLMLLQWRDPTETPTLLRIEETGETLRLPEKPVITAGRLASHEGRAANDLVLAHPDPNITQYISRWHFQLERSEDGSLALRQLSRGVTEVDGETVEKGESVALKAGSVIRLSRVLTLTLVAEEPGTAVANATVIPRF